MSTHSVLNTATKVAAKPSALTKLISTTSTDPLAALTTQVLHNLQHQHLWTSLEIHNTANISTTTSLGALEPETQPVSVAVTPGLPIPLISGIPPHRTYTHPDEQLYLLEIGLREDDLPAERLWVLPTTQGQTWTLGRLATVFDALPPRTVDSVARDEHDNDIEEHSEEDDDKDKAEKLARYSERRQKADERGEWGGKRLLLAMVDRLVGGDGTIVYYVVHDGHVKPRQN